MELCGSTTPRAWLGISFKAGERARVDEGTIYGGHKVQVYRKRNGIGTNEV